MPRRRRRVAVPVAEPEAAAAATPLKPPPIPQGVDAVVAWVGEVNLAAMAEPSSTPSTRHKHRAVQQLISAFGRVKAAARDVELVLRAREQREDVAAGGAYCGDAPVGDAVAMPLWHAMELARLLHLVSSAAGMDKDDVDAVAARIRHHVAGVTVREQGWTSDFKRRHKIGSDVAGAVAGYAAVQAQLEKEALTQGDAEDAADDLVGFGHFMKSDFASPWHVQVVCDALMRAERRELRGLIINLPPRRGKSTCASELFPAWYLGRHPSHDIIVATHSQSFADSVGRKIRNAMQSSEFQRVFPGVRIAGDSSAAAVFEITVDGASARQRRGNCKAFGRGGAPAGSGSNCFPAGTMISTEIGPIPIETFCQLGYSPPRVLTYDQRSGKPVWGYVVASAKRRAKGIVTVTARSGRTIVATPEHPVYSGGWREAKDLQPGDSLIAERASCMSFVQSEPVHKSPALQTLRDESQGDHLCSAVLCLQEGVRQGKSRGSKGDQEQISVCLLQSGVLQQAQRDEADTSAPLCSLRQDIRKGPQILLNAVPSSVPVSGTDERVRHVREIVPTAFGEADVLRQDLCRQSPFDPNAWTGELAFQGWDQLHRLVSEDAPSDSGARRAQVCNVQPNGDEAADCSSRYSNDALGSSDPPHRRESARQPNRKSDHSLRGVPYVLPQIEIDVVSEVHRSLDVEVDVYDLQVAEHSCFFAGEILVHNCLLIDDFLSEQDAYSSTERGHLLDDLLAFRTRLAPDAIWIVINTRYHEDDVVGVVKRDFADDREWTVITLPEFAEVDEEWVVTRPGTRRRKAERLTYRRRAGDVLWPERFSAESSEQLKAALLKAAPHKWFGQFMCRPVPSSGALVDVSWFRRYDYAEVDEMAKRSHRIVVSVDTGGTKLHSRGGSSARTAITVWGELVDGRCYLLDVRAEPWIYPDIIGNIKEVCAEWRPTDLLIEDKAAGVDVVVDLAEQRDWVQTPITAVMPYGPKETRMAVATPAIRQGRVYLPAQGECVDVASPRSRAPAWLEDYLNEVMHFPLSTHKDMCLNGDMHIPVLSDRVHLKPAAQVVVGDLLLTHTGEWRPVTEVFVRHHEGDICVLRRRGSPVEVEITQGHPVWVLPGQKGRTRTYWPLPSSTPQWLPASDIGVGDVVHDVNVIGLKRDVIDLAETPGEWIVSDEWIKSPGRRGIKYPRKVPINGEVCRLLGYYLAEGSVGHHNVSFAFHAEENDLVADTIAIIGTYFGAHASAYLNGKDNCKAVSCSSRLLTAFFGNIFGKGAPNKSLPLWIFGLSDENLFQFMKGAYLGDGCWSKNLVYTTSSRALAWCWVRLLARFDMAANITVSRKNGGLSSFNGREKPSKTRPLYNVIVSGAKADTFAARIGFSPDRERVLIRQTDRVKAGTAERMITETGTKHFSGLVYNFAVADAHTYHTEVFLVHNCDSTSQFLNWRRENPLVGGIKPDRDVGGPRGELYKALAGPWGRGVAVQAAKSPGKLRR